MNLKIIFFILICSISISCRKESGEGGFASIEGKVYVKDYDASYTLLTSEYYLPGETVYIIYGDAKEVGNTVKTSYDGSFKFNYLRKGKYKVYVIGDDPAQPYKSIPKEELREVTITKKKENVKLNDLVIIK